MKTNPYATKCLVVRVANQDVMTDQEGYIQDMDQWSADYALALAKVEGLTLNDDHWQIIHYIRDYFVENQVQATVRHMIKHFREVWGPERGNNHYLHDLFPKGGPQKQGNRLAGIRRTKGEH